MLALLVGTTRRLQGTSKKGNEYDFYNLQAVWRDDTLGGFRATEVYTEPVVFQKRLQSWLESNGTFPILANIDFDNNKHLISLTLLDTTKEDIEHFFFED